MTHRYSLRFETGERSGETVPVTGPRFTIGRRPGNSLQIVENSVSGRHAELTVDAQGVFLRDLGSTNGTRVDHERVLESRLAAGARVHIGNVALTFVDAELVAAATGTGGDVAGATDGTGATGAFGGFGGDGGGAPSAADAFTQSPDGENGFDVSSADLERARSGSFSALLVIVILGALIGAGGWYFTRGGGSAEAQVVTPVTPVPGNLLAAGYSFEDDGSGGAGSWTSRDTAPSGFVESNAAAVSGQRGLATSLAPGEWALHESPPVRVQGGRVLRFGATLSAEGAAVARVGVELYVPEDEGDEPGARAGLVTVWSDRVSGSGPTPVALELSVPPGYKRARLVLLGTAPGEAGASAADAESEEELLADALTVTVDDAWLVPQSGGSPAATLEEFKLFALGDPATSLALYRVDEPLFTGLRERGAGASTGMEIAGFELAPGDVGVEVRPTGRAGPATLHLRVEAAATAGGVATIGAEGYVRHSVEFERAGVTDLLLGSGLDLVRLSFTESVRVSARPVGRAFLVACERPSSTPFNVQLKFRTELDAASNLARDAEQAEQAGRLGVCLAKWQDLLDSYPFDERHLATAEETRGRLILQGLEEARAIGEEVERARFFRLIDLYRECLADATDLAQRFKGSEVEPEARRLAGEVQAAIAELEVDLDQHEKARLEGILRTLQAQGAEKLAGEVQAYLAEHFGGAD